MIYLKKESELDFYNNDLYILECFNDTVLVNENNTVILRAYPKIK